MAYRFAGTDILADLAEKYGYSGDLAQFYAQPSGYLVHKWHHYLPLYDRYFAPFRDRPVRMLEIGVSRGGSLALWRRYFGASATIFGIDIDPTCAQYDGRSGQVRIGSQTDATFLNGVVDEMGGLDIVLDDGSHRMAHIRASLRCLFPRLADGGIYVIEDLHTAYDPRFDGGLRAEENFFVEVRKIIDDMHHWYHRESPHDRARARSVTGLHVHDSMVVLDKGPVHPPSHSKVGPA